MSPWDSSPLRRLRTPTSTHNTNRLTPDQRCTIQDRAARLLANLDPRPAYTALVTAGIRLYLKPNLKPYPPSYWSLLLVPLTGPSYWYNLLYQSRPSSSEPPRKSEIVSATPGYQLLLLLLKSRMYQGEGDQGEGPGGGSSMPKFQRFQRLTFANLGQRR
jgi:hypothetical protein